MRALFQSRLQYEGDQVTLWLVIFTNFAALMRTGCIEVTQGNVLDILNFIEP
ncbi:hypothetical protein D3C74_439320 [compost metagenome]